MIIVLPITKIVDVILITVFLTTIIFFLIKKIRDKILIIFLQVKKNIFSDTKKVDLISIIVFTITKK